MSPRPATALLLFPFLLCTLSSCNAALPQALVVKVTQDSATLQYIAQIQQKTPLQTESLVLDLTGDFLWVQCDNGAYKSSTYRPVLCRTVLCMEAESISCVYCYGPPAPGCNNNTCGVFPENTVAGTTTGGDLSQDVVAAYSTDGKNPGPKVTAPGFAFSCAPSFLMQGLAKGASGMAGLSRARLAPPTQLFGASASNRKFALCLPSTGSNTPGVLFFGNGPYFFLPGIDASQRLSYTPLLNNPRYKNQYFIGVTAIQIDGKSIAVDSARLKFDSEGKGGTKLSSVVPYTIVATPIYTAIRDAFVDAAKARNITRVASVKPFGACFDASTVLSTRVGPSVPAIGLVLQKNITWSIFGANSMVQVSNGALCLGFVDGGADPITSIVIGTQQMQNNLIQFDLAASRLGFSSTLLGSQTTCSNFNFTSTA